MGNRFQATDRFADGAQYIGGRLRPGTSGEDHHVIDPATGKTVYTYALASTADVDEAVAAAKAAFPGWAGATPGERSDALHRFAGVLAERAETSPAPSPSSAASRSSSPPSSTCPARSTTPPSSPGPPATSRARPPPSTPATTPPTYGASPSASSAPSPLELPPPDGRLEDPPGGRRRQHDRPEARRAHPLTSLMFAQAATDAGIPDGVINIVNGAGRTVGEHLVGHPDVVMTSFTGSTPVGKRVAEIATATVKRLHLELGGKAPSSSSTTPTWRPPPRAPSPPPSSTAARTAPPPRARTSSAPLRRLHRPRRRAHGLRPARRPLRPGHRPRPADQPRPARPGRRLRRPRPRLRHRRHRRRGPRRGPGGRGVLPSDPDHGRRAGQRGRAVGDLRPGPGGPALRHRRRGHRARQRHPYGLAASAWSRDVYRTGRATREIKAGCVWVNDHIPIISEMPHGGTRASGYGKDMSAYSFEEYTQVKHVMYDNTAVAAKDWHRTIFGDR